MNVMFYKKTLKVLSTVSLAGMLLLPATNFAYGEESKNLIEGIGINAGLTFEANGDMDGDGLTNQEENELGTSVAREDTDGDGYGDATEREEQGTDPTRIDTDGDGLHDDIEIEIFETNPTIRDENGNGVVDGDEKRTYEIPANELGVTGTVTGPGNMPKQFVVIENHNLLVNQIGGLKSFDINEFGSKLSFDITVPLLDKAVDQQPILFKYKDNEVQFIEVKKQKYDKTTNSIQATTDGGTHVVLSKEDYKDVVKENKKLKKLNKKILKELKKQDKSIRFLNFPNYEIKASQIQDIDKEVGDGKIRTIEDAFQVENGDKSAIYQIDSVYQEESTNQIFATGVAMTAESGMAPIIFIHGMNSSPAGAFEINMKWENDYGHADANESIDSTESYTGNTYSWAENQPYSNVDVHFIDSYQNNDDNIIELPERLIEYNGYTPNVDLFAYQYGANNHVGIAGDDLGSFISGLRTYVSSIPSYQDFNIIAHSKGGLVSRHFIETATDGTHDITRLITFGTPHMGVNNSALGDLDRGNSRLWDPNIADDDSETLQGEDAYDANHRGHPYTKYFAFAGVKDDLEDVPDAEENQYYIVPNNNDVQTVDANSYENWYANRYNITDSCNGISNICGFGDGFVSIDSALGSDLDPDSPQQISHVDMTKKWLWIGVDGGHSEFKRLYASYTRVEAILKGLHD